MTLSNDEQAFLCQVWSQLDPAVRAIFATRVADFLRAHPDAGPGDLNRAIRTALAGLWTPPDLDGLRGSRWDSAAPRFDLASKRAG